MPRAQLENPADATTEGIINTLIDRLLPSKILDIFWNKLFYWSTWFEAADGYDITTSGSGAAAPTGNAFVLTSDTSTNTSTEITKFPNTQNILRWDRKQRMRATISTPTAVTSQEAYVVVGNVNGGTINEHYGFRINNATLQGTVSDSATQVTVDLDTAVSTSSDYNVEARYIPYKEVTFYVDGIAKGKLTSNLPSGAASITHDNLFDAWIKTTTNAARTLRISFFEFIQER